MEKYDVVIIGGGPAGLAAAISAKENGIDCILILERDKELGGILNQCIHNGFGLHTFKEELTGPEYAGRFIERVKKLDIEYRLNTMVMEISPKKIVTAMNREEGLFELSAGAVILAMGCRERSRGALNIPGYRPAGIFSAGTAQRLVNMEGYMPGREVVILGSGDIGLIMARRMTLEGAKVKVVAELMPYSGGLKRNIVQCLDDYGIPLKLSHTVVDIRGKERLTGVTLAEVDSNGRPIPGTEEEYSCDTLLLSVGLIPENEISGEMGVEINPVTSGPRVNESLETNLEGVFACGNVLHVHDLVDFVSEEAAAAGRSAAAYVKAQAGMPKHGGEVQTEAQAGMRADDGEVQTEAQAGMRADDGEVQTEARPGISENGAEVQEIRLVPESGVRYTVPESINLERWARMISHEGQHSVGGGQTAGDSDNWLTVRFRVGNVYKNCFISAYFDEERVIHRKRSIVTPGEMEEISLNREQLLKYPGLKTITIKIEEA